MRVNERAVLKDITEIEFDLILKWRNQEFIRNVMYNSDLISQEQHTCWFENLKENDKAVSKVFYYNDIPYGILNITQIDHIKETCEWGFYIGDPNAPKGMGTILGYTSLNYIFEKLKIHKLSAEVLDYNFKSIIFHEKLGFKQEGKLCKHILKNGNYIDILLFGLLESEWKMKSMDLKRQIEGRFI